MATWHLSGKLTDPRIGNTAMNHSVYKGFLKRFPHQNFIVYVYTIKLHEAFRNDGDLLMPGRNRRPTTQTNLRRTSASFL